MTRTWELTKCPYCAQRSGRIYVDLDRLTSLKKRLEDDFLHANLAPHLNPYVFRSGPGADEPCHHLISLSSEFCHLLRDGKNTLVRTARSLTCEWAAVVDRHNPRLERFVVQLTNKIDTSPGTCIPLGTQPFHMDWSLRMLNGVAVCSCSIEGRGLFCRDANAFFDDLLAHQDRYNDWWNGQDVKGTGLLVEGFTAEQLCGGSPGGNSR